MRLYIGLLHYPVYDKNRRRIASAITTVDLHDLSRLARTYGVKSFFVINPLEDQQRLAERILHHWIDGFGAGYNRNRKEAIELMLEDFGIEPERFRLEWVSASEAIKFATVVNGFVEEIKELGPSTIGVN